MAETLVSPGVLARENDQSQITAQPIQAGDAIVGPTVKGKKDIPTLVTSYSEYKAQYGSTFTSGSDEYTFLTSISAYNYFNNGGTSLLVARVASGSFTPATASAANNVSVTGGAKATGSTTFANNFGETAEDEFKFTVGSTTYRFIGDSSPVFFLATGSTEINYSNQLVVKVNGVLSSTVSASSDGAAGFALSGSSVGTTLNTETASTGSGAGSFGTAFTFGGGTAGSGTGTAFILETFAEGIVQNSTSTEGTNNTLPSGSTDNLRYEVVAPNTSSGTFSLLIRRGNDTINQKVVLESYQGLSLDPKQDNYISKIIGDVTDTVVQDADGTYFVQPTGSYPNASRYVRVKSVSNTVDYFDNNGTAKTSFTSYIPNAGSGSFGAAAGTILTGIGKYYQNISATDTQGLVAGNYTKALGLLNNKDEYDYDLLTAPGLTQTDYTSPVSTMISQAQTRGDYIAVIDLKLYGNTVGGAINAASGIDNSYASTYWPWVQTTDPDTGNLV